MGKNAANKSRRVSGDGGGSAANGPYRVPGQVDPSSAEPELQVTGTAEIAPRPGNLGGGEEAADADGQIRSLWGSADKTDVSGLFDLSKDAPISTLFLNTPQRPPLAGGASITSSRIVITKDIKMLAGPYGVTVYKASDNSPVTLYPWPSIARVSYVGID